MNILETGKIIRISYSLTQDCITNQINPLQYLTYVLNYALALRYNEIEPLSLLLQFIDQNPPRSSNQ